MRRKYSIETAKITASTPSSVQLALPRLPKVQKTTAPSFCSSAKYCSSVLPPEKSELSATPASTSPPGPMSRLKRDMAMMTAVEKEPQTKAQSVTM